MLVFRPTSASELAEWVAGSRPQGAAYAITPSFLAAFDLESEPDDEDAERTLLYIAGLDALLGHGARLVAVAEASATDLASELGAVETSGIPWSAVTALFADAPESAEAVSRTASAAHGLDVAEAWDQPEHERLLAEHDLLWYGPDEWGVLAGRGAPAS